MISGGESYIWAAYGIGFALFMAYGLYLWAGHIGLKKSAVAVDFDAEMSHVVISKSSCDVDLVSVGVDTLNRSENNAKNAEKFVG